MRRIFLWPVIFAITFIMLFSCANAAGGGNGGGHPQGMSINFNTPIALSELNGKSLMPVAEYRNGTISLDNNATWRYYYFAENGTLKEGKIDETTNKFSTKDFSTFDEYTARITSYRAYDESKGGYEWRFSFYRFYQCGEYIIGQYGHINDNGLYGSEENAENIDISSLGTILWQPDPDTNLYKLVDNRVIINFYASGASEDAITWILPADMKFRLPSPQNFGVNKNSNYEYVGWCEDVSADRIDQSIYGDPIRAIGTDTNLYPVWSYPATYTITFYGNGTQFSDHGTKKETVTQTLSGNGINGIFTYPFKTLYDLGIYFCERAGFTHVGWAKNPTSAVIEYKDPDRITLDSDTNLYAVWKCPKSHKITFNANGGSLSKDSQLATADCLEFDPNIPPVNISLKTASDLNLSRSGYRFRGWALQNDAEDVLYPDGASMTVTTDTTLYALWDKEVTYTITFKKNANGAAIVTETQSILGTELTGVHGELLKASDLGLIQLYESGPAQYLFKGWSKSSTATPQEVEYINGQEIELTEDITLYAVWHLPEYTIRFSNGGISIPDRTLTGYGAITTMPAAGTKNGYTFKGWQTGGSIFYAGEDVSIKGDTVFTAVWAENCYYIRLYYPGSTNETLKSMVYALQEVEGYSGVSGGWSYNTSNATYSPRVKITGPKKSIACAVKYTFTQGDQTGYVGKTATLNFNYGNTYIINVVTGEVLVQ